MRVTKKIWQNRSMGIKMKKKTVLSTSKKKPIGKAINGFVGRKNREWERKSRKVKKI